MAGTKHEQDWIFYHNTLSLMTSKECQEWMEKNQGAYFGRPVGNSPEFMPLDMSLNKDIKEALKYHMIMTKHLPDEHVSKFSMSTPKNISRAILRIVDLNDVVDVNKELSRRLVMVTTYLIIK